MKKRWEIRWDTINAPLPLIGPRASADASSDPVPRSGFRTHRATPSTLIGQLEGPGPKLAHDKAAAGRDNIFYTEVIAGGRLGQQEPRWKGGFRVAGPR